MIAGDIVSILFFIFMVFIFATKTKLSFLGSLIISLCFIVPLLLILRWPKRIKNSRERSKLMCGERQSVIGAFTEIHPADTGKEKTVSVLDGYTQKAFSAEIYNHYHFEKHKVYDGLVGTFELCIQENGQYYYTNQTITIRTLPKTFLNDEDELPPIDRLCELHYATDSKGTNYFIDAESVH